MGAVQVLLIYFALLSTLDATSPIIPKETSTSTTQRVQPAVIRNHAIDIVTNNFTSNLYCKSVAVNLIQTQTTVEASCSELCVAKGALWRSKQCNKHDYNLLNNALCPRYTCPTHAPVVQSTQSPEDLKKLVEIVMCVIDNEISTEMCGNEIHHWFERGYDPEQACRTLQSFRPALGAFHCTIEDYQKLFRVICEKQLFLCSPITSLLRNLTSSCRGVINSSLNQLLAPGACNFIDSQKQHITSNSVCTAGDFVKLHHIVCLNKSSLSQAIREGQQVEKAEDTIKTKLTKTCQESLLPEFQRHGLLELCQIIANSETSLVSQRVCTLKDIELLKPIFCFGHIDYNLSDQRQKDELHSIIETLSNRCKASMLGFEPQTQCIPRKVSCKLLNANRDTLLITNTCTEGEITKVSNLLCSQAQNFRFNWITVLLICLVLNEMYFHF